MRMLIAIAIVIAIFTPSQRTADHDEIQCVSDCWSPLPPPEPDQCLPPRHLLNGVCVPGVWIGQQAHDRSR
jgi:hypothetical protein